MRQYTVKNQVVNDLHICWKLEWNSTTHNLRSYRIHGGLYLFQITETFTLRAWQTNLKLQLHWYINRVQHETLFVELYSYLTNCVSKHQCLMPRSLWFGRYDNEDTDDDFHYFHCPLLTWTPKYTISAYCFPWISIWMHTNCLHMNSLLFYNLQNTLRKSPYFSDRWKLAVGKGRISAKIGFKFACDQLTFWSFTVQSLIQA
jgi:hypothetical protein